MKDLIGAVDVQLAVCPTAWIVVEMLPTSGIKPSSSHAHEILKKNDSLKILGLLYLEKVTRGDKAPKANLAIAIVKKMIR